MTKLTKKDVVNFGGYCQDCRRPTVEFVEECRTHRISGKEYIELSRLVEARETLKQYIQDSKLWGSSRFIDLLDEFFLGEQK